MLLTKINSLSLVVIILSTHASHSYLHTLSPLVDRRGPWQEILCSPLTEITYMPMRSQL